jgi:site-specific DNA-methyltransferase (adenine-specific)
MQERALAIKSLHELRQAQHPEQTVADTAEEVTGRRDGEYQANIRKQLIIADHLDDPDVAKAKTIKEAMKILKVKEERQKHEAKGQALPAALVADSHLLFNCDFRNLPSIPPVDVIITDPPYGMGADSFGNGGDGNISAGGSIVGHAYEDNYESWVPLLKDFAAFTSSCTKPQAHLYCFCDIDRFHELKSFFEAVGWQVHRTPLIFHKDHQASRRVPWPEHGPRRSYELILYAIKGKKPVKQITSDVVQAQTEPNLGHSAQKPVTLWENLLARSCSPGDTVADFFAGTGGALVAAHNLKCSAIICELDPAHYSICHDRLTQLKESSK